MLTHCLFWLISLLFPPSTFWLGRGLFAYLFSGVKKKRNFLAQLIYTDPLLYIIFLKNSSVITMWPLIWSLVYFNEEKWHLTSSPLTKVQVNAASFDHIVCSVFSIRGFSWASSLQPAGYTVPNTAHVARGATSWCEWRIALRASVYIWLYSSTCPLIPYSKVSVSSNSFWFLYNTYRCSFFLGCWNEHWMFSCLAFNILSR